MPSLSFELATAGGDLLGIILDLVYACGSASPSVAKLKGHGADLMAEDDHVRSIKKLASDQANLYCRVHKEESVSSSS